MQLFLIKKTGLQFSKNFILKCIEATCKCKILKSSIRVNLNDKKRTYYICYVIFDLFAHICTYICTYDSLYSLKNTEAYTYIRSCFVNSVTRYEKSFNRIFARENNQNERLCDQMAVNVTTTEYNDFLVVSSIYYFRSFSVFTYMQVRDQSVVNYKDCQLK